MVQVISNIVKPVAAVTVIAALGVGLALAGSAGGVEAWSRPLFTLCGISIFVINWLGYFGSRLAGDDRFADIGRAVTYMVATAVLLVGHPDLSSRVVTVAVFVEAWAIGIGITVVLLRRSEKKSDDSFTTGSPRSSSLRVWTFYALLSYLTVSAGFAAATSTSPVQFGPFSAVGIALCTSGFVLALVATIQRLRAARLGRFASTGLWAWSRHPDLFGQVLVWFGIAVIAYPVLRGWQYLTLMSPLVVYFFAVKALAIPRAETHAEHRFANDQAFNIYTANTPTLWFCRPR